MKQKSFKKGIHPYEAKDYSKDCSIVFLDAEKELVYPLSQHIGKPAQAVVAVSDRVLKGQMIAQAQGAISACVHSAVSGTVKAVEKRDTVSGVAQQCIVIENDYQYETVDGYGEDRDGLALSPQEIADAVLQGGIVGLGGAGFPSYVKLTPKNADHIDYLIINGCECEPYLTADYRLMIEKGDEIVKGIKAMLKLFPKATAIIGIENNKPDAIKALTEKVESDDRIQVQPLKTKYPQGGERQLIFAVTGRKINSKMLPADKGCIVVNTASCYSIYEAVFKNIPLIHKVMTITGEGVNSPCNVDVPLGVSHSYVLEQCHGAKDDAVKFISGGPMMGTAMSTLDVPVVKTSSSILAFSKDDVAASKETACIHCGRCITACPQNVVPQLLAKAVRAKDYDKFESLGGMECIECGCCTYECPAKIPLTQMCKLARAVVREKNSKR